MSEIRSLKHSQMHASTLQRARELTAKEDWQCALGLLSSIPEGERDLPVLHLLGRVHIKLENFRQARRFLELSYAQSKKDEKILRDLIEVHLHLQEYQKALYCMNLLFTLETDHTQDIIKVLEIYRELGLFERAKELLQTLEQNGYNTQTFELEKLQLAMELHEQNNLRKVLKDQNKNQFFHPRILERAKRQLEIQSRGDLKTSLYIQGSNVLLGSIDDDGTLCEILENYQYNTEALYESCLRFVDIVQDNFLKFENIIPFNENSQRLARFLSTALSLPLKKEVSSNRSLIVANSMRLTELAAACKNNPVFSLVCELNEAKPSQLDSIQRCFLGKVLNGSCQFSYLEELEEELYSTLSNLKHMSSQCANGRAFFLGLESLPGRKSAIRSLPPRLGVNPRNGNSKTFGIDEIIQEIKEEGFLYYNSYRDSLLQQSLEKHQLMLLLDLHKENDFAPCDLSRILAFHDHEACAEFYKDSVEKGKELPRVWYAALQIPSKDLHNLWREVQKSDSSKELVKEVMRLQKQQLNGSKVIKAVGTSRSVKRLEFWEKKLRIEEFQKYIQSDKEKDKLVLSVIAKIRNTEYELLAREADRALAATSDLEKRRYLLSFLIFNSPHPRRYLEEIFSEIQLKQEMRNELIEFLETKTNMGVEKDLLFLMQEGGSFAVRTAIQLVHHGDMEYFMFLVQRLKAYAPLFGFSIFKTLFQCRSEKASELLIQGGIASHWFTPTQVLDCLLWLEQDGFRLDEFLMLLRDRHRAAHAALLKNYMKQQLMEHPEYFRLLIRFFPELKADQLESCIRLPWKTEEKLKLIEPSFPSLAKKWSSNQLNSDHLKFPKN